MYQKYIFKKKRYIPYKITTAYYIAIALLLFQDTY